MRLAFLLALAYSLAFLDRALVAAAGGLIKQDLGLSDTQFGLLSGTAFAFLFCLCSLPMGWLADRINRRTLIAGGLLFWSAMTAACGLADDFLTFGLARIGVGLGEACLIPAGMSLLAGTVAPHWRARAVAIFLIGATSGNALALLGGGYLLSLHLSWRALFVGAGLLGLPMAAIFRGPEPARPPAASGTSDLRAAFGHLLAHRPAYFFLTAATACSIALAQAQAVWIPQFFSRRFGHSPGEAAMLAGVIFILSAPVGQWIGGLAIDRLTARNVPGPANLALAIFCAASLPPAVIFCTAETELSAVIAYALFNFAVFAATPAGLSGWQALTPARNQGVVIALLTSMATLAGVGLGPLTVGLLAESRPIGRSLLILILAAGSGAIALGLAGRAPFVRDRRPAHSPPGTR